MRQPRFALTLAALLVLTAAGADALDNDRRGFVIGLGAGWGSATDSTSAGCSTTPISRSSSD